MTDQETCGACNGSGRMPRDPNIGTDQECFVCDGSGFIAAHEAKQATAQALPSGWRITKLDGADAYVINGPFGGCVAVKDADIARVIPEAILYELAAALAATPAPAPAQERCHLCDCTGDIHDATGEWRGECPYCKPAQEVGLTDEEIDAIASKYMSTVGDHWCNEEAIRERHAEDFARAIIAALRAKGAV